MFDVSESKICIVGMGYVGLPLAAEFGKHFPTVGFDVNSDRLLELEKGVDSTLEVSESELALATQLSYTNDIQSAADCNVFIVTVPTPINEHK